MERWERFTRGTGYLLIGAGAVWLLTHPPSTMTHALGFWLTVAWCGFILTAVPAGIAVYLGNYTREYVCLPFFTGALVVALIHGYLRIDEDSVVRLSMVTGLVLLLVARWFKIHNLVQRPIRRRRTRRFKWTGIKLPR